MEDLEEVPIGSVQNTKNMLEAKEDLAIKATPKGMEFIGWTLDGWHTIHTLLDSNARPIYAFPLEKE